MKIETGVMVMKNGKAMMHKFDTKPFQPLPDCAAKSRHGVELFDRIQMQQYAMQFLDLHVGLLTDSYEAGKRDAAPGWQPIETAPKDEQVLLAVEFDRAGDWRIKVGYYDESQFGCWKIFGASWIPTHWMPFPASPSND